MSAARAAGRSSEAPDGRDHGVEHVDRLQQTLDDVGAGARLAQPEVRAPGDHLDLVVRVVATGPGPG